MSPDAEMRSFREQERQDTAKRLARAVADVLSGDVTLRDAARNRKVSDVALRKALTERGWTPPHLSGPRRRTSGSGERRGA